MLSRHLISSFKECLKDYETLRTIDELFTDLDISFDADIEAGELERDGARRSRAAGYIATLDLTTPQGARPLLDAIGIKLAEWEANGVHPYSLDRLRRRLSYERLTWNGKRLEPTAGPLAPHAQRALEAGFGVAAVDDEVERIFSNLDRDPAAAITAARALVESSCKVVLERKGQRVPHGDDLPSLYKKAATALNIDPVQHELPVFRQTLQGLVSSIQGLAELRNTMSSAHGRGPKSFRPAPRHARVAVGAAWTVATFMAETLAEHERKGS